MFSFLNSLAKAAVSVVVTPVAVVADVVTLGEGSKSGSYTGDTLGAVIENISDAVDPAKD